MIDNPQYAKIGDKKYKINTSYKVALKCNDVSNNDNISDYEKMLAIIYLLFGDEGLKDRQNHQQLLDIAFRYLSCGEDEDDSNDSNEEPDMDFKQDFRLIRASFKSDYGIDLQNEDLHWYDFYMYLNGLSDDCILNRIRGLRTFDVSKIEDNKERNNILKSQRRFALKKKEIKLTKEQIESIKELDRILGKENV